MLDKYELPKNLLTVISEEKIDFAVTAKKAKPLKSSIGILLFGLAWTSFTSIFVFAFLWPLFVGEEVHFTSDGVQTVASPDNLEPIIVPALIIGLFLLIGLLMLSYGFYSMLKPGGYFCGTRTRFISYFNNSVRSIDWEQFSGDIEVKGDEFNGSIALRLRTGSMVSSKNRGSRYVPDVINMVGITNVFEIEQYCRRRIKENDPTPVNSNSTGF